MDRDLDYTRTSGALDNKDSAGHVENSDVKEYTTTEEFSKLGVQAEHELTLKQALIQYKKAILWSMLFALTIVMDGYDGNLPGAFAAQPAFQKSFGELQPDGSYVIPARWLTALGMGAPIGRVFGGLGVGYFASRFGRKLTLYVSLLLTTGLIFIVFFAPNVGVLCAGFILSGCMWGVFNTLAPTYSSEVCPVILRGFLTAYINLSWVIGQLVAQGVLNGVEGRTDQWAYKIPFAVQWVWPLIIICILPFAPESPWWLVRKGRLEEAERSLIRLSNSSQQSAVKERLAMMVATDKMEQETSSGSSFWDCFKGTDLRRTEISCMAWSIQTLSGNGLIGYATFFFAQAGLASGDAFKLSLGLSAIGFCGTVASWFLTGLFGRRANYIYGLSFLIIIMFIIGFIDLGRGSADTNGGLKWAQSVLLLIWTFIYDLTIGPVCYVIVGETSSTRLREKTIALATVAYSLWGVVFQVAQPYMLGTDEGNWRGKIGFLYGGTGLISLVWCWFRLPELSKRTYNEIDALFEMKLKARDFKRYEFNYDDDINNRY